DVTAVNDAPAGANTTVTTLEDTAYTFTAANFGFTDANDPTAGHTLSAVTISTLATNGTILLNGVAVTAGQSVTIADINSGLLTFAPAANANGAAYAQFTFAVQDSGGTANGGVDTDQTPNTMTISVTAVNDAPAGTDTTVTVNEDNTFTFTTANFGFTDTSDSPANTLSSVVITTLPVNGALTLNGVAVTAGQSITAANITSGQLRFAPAANANGAAYANFTFQVRDGGGTANGGVDLDASPNTMTIDVTSVNDAPAGTNNTVTTLEDTAHVFTAAQFGFSDVNDTPANTLIAVRISALPAAGSLRLNGIAVTAGQFVTLADINAGLLTFSPALNANGASYASFTFQVQDSGGTSSGGVDLDQSANTMTINVTAVDDAPVAGANTGLTVGEGATATITTTMLTTTDVDTAAASVIYTVTSTVTNGRLELSTAAGVAITTFTQADLAANRVRYVHNGTETTTDSFTFTVTDGTATLAAATFNVTITPVNDPPVISANSTLTVLEGGTTAITTAQLSATDPDTLNTALVYTVTTVPLHGRVELSSNPGVAVTSFTQADIVAGIVQFVHDGSEAPTDTFRFSLSDGTTTFPNLTFNVGVTPVDDAPVVSTNTGATVNEGSTTTITTSMLSSTDPDTAAGSVLYTVTSTVLNGRLELSTAPGVAITTFTQADLAAGLVRYVHDGSETLADSFTFTVQDGTTTLAAAGFNIIVTPVNDPPVVTVNTPANLNEGASTIIDTTFLSATDIDSAIPTLTYTLTSNPLHGRLELTTNAGVAITSFTQADLAAGIVRYVHNGDEQATDRFRFTVGDGQDASAITQFDITVNPVNDPPSDIFLTRPGFPQGLPVGVVFTDIRTVDPDNTNASLTYTIIGSPSIFQLVGGDKLALTSSPNPQTDPRVYTIRVRVDDGMYQFEKDLTIVMTDGGYIPPYVPPDGDGGGGNDIPQGWSPGHTMYEPIHNTMMSIRYGEVMTNGDPTMVSTSPLVYGGMQIDAYYGDGLFSEVLREGAIFMINDLVENGAYGTQPASASAQFVADALDGAGEGPAKPPIEEQRVRELQEGVQEWIAEYRQNPLFQALLGGQSGDDIEHNQLAQQMAKDFVKKTSQQLDEAAKYYQGKHTKLMAALNKKK
ncbi:MAG: cadherin-like domain-containing protein, partial [Alphaproteobacteria bacterium]